MVNGATLAAIPLKNTIGKEHRTPFVFLLRQKCCLLLGAHAIWAAIPFILRNRAHFIVENVQFHRQWNKKETGKKSNDLSFVYLHLQQIWSIRL